MTYAYRIGLPIVVLAFLVYSLPPYLVGDTRVPATFGLHHPLLLGHVALGTVALVGGYLAARAGRYATHRRRMLLSVTLALSVITNRLWAPVLFLICDPLWTSVFGGDDERYLWFTAGVAGWLGWVLPLAAVGWLHRRPAVAATSIPTVSEVPRV